MKLAHFLFNKHFWAVTVYQAPCQALSSEHNSPDGALMGLLLALSASHPPPKKAAMWLCQKNGFQAPLSEIQCFSPMATSGVNRSAHKYPDRSSFISPKSCGPRLPRICFFFSESLNHLFFVFCFCFLGLHPQNMAVPRLGVKSKLQL